VLPVAYRLYLERKAMSGFPIKHDAVFRCGEVAKIEPWHAYCPKHGKVFNWIEVAHDPGYPHNGRYCQKCYVENVLVPNCGKLSDVSSEDCSRG
jgi:hypothetical protein